MPEPEEIDMEFRVSWQQQNRLSYSVTFDGERFLFWGGYRMPPGAELPVPWVQGAQYYPREGVWRDWPDLEDPDAAAVAEHWGFDGLRIFGGVRTVQGEVRWDFSEQSYSAAGVPNFVTYTWDPPTPIDEAFPERQPTLVDDGLILGVTDDEPPQEFAYLLYSGPIAPPPHGLSPYRYDKSDQGLVFGPGGTPEDPVVTGGIFDGGSWQPLPEQNRPSARWGHSVANETVWGGQEWGGPYTNDGARNSSDEVWTPMTLDGAPTPRRDHAAIGITGWKTLFFGGWDSEKWLNDGAIYDALEDRWTPLPSACAPPPMKNPVALWTGVPNYYKRGDDWRENAVLVFGTSTEDDRKGVGGLLLLPGVCCVDAAGGVTITESVECGVLGTELPIEECADHGSE